MGTAPSLKGIYAGGLHIARIALNTQDARFDTLFYHCDALGSPRKMTDKNGNVAWSQWYYPFGEPVGGSYNTHKFTGKEWDIESDLYYFCQRYYDSNIGRFISFDPLHGLIELPQSMMRYGYCMNNPLRFIDPLGLDGYEPWLDPRFLITTPIVVSGKRPQQKNPYDPWGYRGGWSPEYGDLGFSGAETFFPPEYEYGVESGLNPQFGNGIGGSSASSYRAYPQIHPRLRQTETPGYQDINASLGELVVVTGGQMISSSGRIYDYLGTGLNWGSPFGITINQSSNVASPGYAIALQGGWVMVFRLGGLTEIRGESFMKPVPTSLSE